MKTKKFKSISLNKSDETLNAVLASIGDLIYTFDGEGRLTFVNFPAKQKLLLPGDEVIGKKHIDILPGDIYNKFQKAFDDNKSGVTSEFEYLLKTNGSEEWYSCKLSPILKNKKFDGSVAIVRDITKKKKEKTARDLAYEETRQSRRHYRNLFKNSPISIWEEDLSSVVKYLEQLKNEGITDLLTYLYEKPDELKKCIRLIKTIDVNEATLEVYEAETKEDFIKGIDKIFCRESYKIIEEGLVAISQGKTKFTGEGITETLTGKKKNIILSLSVETDTKEPYSRVILSIVDITERKKTNEALVLSENKLSKAFDLNPSPMAITVIETGEYIDINRSFKKIIGYESNEVIGKTSKELNIWKNNEDRDRIRNELRINGRISNYEFPLITKSGQEKIGLFSGEIFEHSGKNHLLSTVLDITERKLSEKIIIEQRDFAVSLNNAETLEDAFNITADIIDRVFKMDSFGLYVLDYETEVVKLILHKGLSSTFVEETSNYNFLSPNAQVILKGDPVFTIFDQLAADINYVQNSEGLKAIAVIPIKKDDRVVACLNLGSHILENFPEYMQNSITSIAAQIANTINRINTQEELLQNIRELERRTTEVSSLLDSTSAVLDMTDYTTAAQTVFNHCKAITGATAGYVALLSGDGSENEVLFLDSGGRICKVDPDLPMPIRGLRGVAYDKGKVVYDNGFWNSPYKKMMPGGHMKLDNVMFVPLTIDDKVQGIMGLSNKPGGFNQDDADIAFAFGNLAAIGLRNNRLIDSLKENEEIFRMISQTISDLAYSIEIDWKGNILGTWHAGSVEKITGYTLEELKSAGGWRKIILSEDQNISKNHIRKLFSGSQETAEYRITTKSGKNKWIRDYAKPIYDKSNKRIEIIHGALQDITREIEFNEMLKTTNEFYESILEGIINGVWVTNKDDMIFYANDRMNYIEGVPRNGIVGQNVFHDSSGEMVNELLPYYKTARETLKPQYYSTISITTLSGEKSYQSGSLIPRIHDNKYNGMICTVDDVTVIEEIKEHNFFLAEVLKNAPLSVIVSDAQGIITYINPSAEDIFGYKNDEIVGQSLDIMNASPDKVKIQSEIMKKVDKNGIWKGEILNKSKNGRLFYIYATVYKLVDRDNNVIALVGFQQDITDRKNAEMALVESEEKFRAMFEGSHELMSLADENLNTIWVNRAWIDTLGYTQDTLGNSIEKIHPDDVDKFKNAWDKFSKENISIFNLEYRFRKKSGEYIWLQSSMQNLRFENKELYFIAANDITERALYETKLQKSLEEKDLLLREVYHRVKNNMQLINSMLTLQARRIEDETAKTKYEESIKRIHSMALVHELLYQSEDMSKINIKNYIEKLSSSLMNSIFVSQQKIQLKTNIHYAYKININIAIPCGLIINEIITNSLKYAFRKNQEGIILIQMKKNEKKKFVLKISDNGKGLPASIKIDKTNTLGLQLINALVEQLNGELSISRQKGTTYKIQFPS